MMNRVFRIALPATAAALPLAAMAAASATSASTAPSAADFQRDVRPILEARCWSCHGPADARSGLRLDSRAAALKGGHGGPALAPGQSGKSALMRRVTSRDARTLMPPGRPLEPREIAVLRAWIDAGAPWPSGENRPGTASGTHWSFVPPRRPAVPAVKDAAWVRNPVDAFVLARLEREGRKPAPEADRLTLLRRVTLDLTGLPPTPGEIDAFLADRAPGAYERVVGRLLASPAYGERWAQHWLDVVRYAETNGFELDGDRPQAWRYRDWVVRALNADMPYDRFLQLQIAGDLLAPEDFDARVATGFLRAGPQHVVGGNVDPAMTRQEWLTEAVTGVGNAVLGLTIQCARCHDHKFDPIPQSDYYRLQAFFAGAANTELKRPAPGEVEQYEAALKSIRERTAPLQAQIGGIEQPYRERLRAEKIARLDPEYREALALPAEKRTSEQKRLAANAGPQIAVPWDELVAALTPEDRARRAALRAQVHAIENTAPEPPTAAPGVAESLSPAPATFVLVRGEPHVRGARVEPGVPAALQAPAPPSRGEKDRRPVLAEWLTRRDHPLTARVMVNRVWQGHFGRGLVPTPNDFGRHGAAPTDPALLDWLAAVFAAPPVPGASPARSGKDLASAPGIPVSAPAKGSAPAAGRTGSGDRGPGTGPGLAWSLKELHYLLVTSSAYRQASTAPRRLDAEAIRDSVLAAAGTLNRHAGGPSVRVPLEPEVYDTIFTEGEPDNLWPVTADPAQHARRSLYLFRKRNVRLPMLAVFDQPDAMSSCAARGESVHALQSLTLMNSDFMLQQSRAFAGRLLRDAGGQDDPAIRQLYLRALGREPRPEEVQRARRFLLAQEALVRRRLDRGEPVARLEGLPGGVTPARAAAWADLCLATFNLNEFVYVW